ncbi:F-box protein SKIP23-like [Vicia villosa]|uniref:F-box protein SKIP23-like n=1 Tax=Vicia villosa TaxID=3911 RepID=UPI00273B00AF|nr:F-box protein SKIP23-like [Vicia villosa]
MADWTMLPKELLQLISEKLNSEFYRIRFRSVCSTWRFSIPKPYNPFPFYLPQFPDSSSSSIYSRDSDIHKLDKHNIFILKPPTTPNQQTLYRPWLVRISPTSSGKFNLWHPLSRNSLNIPYDSSVLDISQLSVFDIAQMYDLSTPVAVFHGEEFMGSVATFQGEEILDIVTQGYSGEMVMLRHGDDSWKQIPNEAHFYHDICIFKGRPCLADGTGRTVMIGSNLSVHLVAEPVYGGYLYGDIKIMVEYESELLLVHKQGYHHRGDLRIDVFRVDQKEKKWLRLANLGDTVVFFGQCHSFTASALDLGFDKGNFVIHFNNNDMSIFHLDQRQNSLLSDYPDYLKLFWPPPEWIISRCL